MSSNTASAPTPLLARMFALTCLVVALAALRMGLSYIQPRGALFWLVTAGFSAQALASAAFLAVSLFRDRRRRPAMRPAVEPTVR